MRYSIVDKNTREIKTYDSLNELVQNIPTSAIDDYIDDDWGSIELPGVFSAKISYIMRTSFPAQYKQMIKKWRENIVEAISDYYIDLVADFDDGYYDCFSIENFNDLLFNLSDYVIIDKEIFKKIIESIP